MGRQEGPGGGSKPGLAKRKGCALARRCQCSWQCHQDPIQISPSLHLSAQGSLAWRSSQLDLGKGPEPAPRAQPSKPRGALGLPSVAARSLDPQLCQRNRGVALPGSSPAPATCWAPPLPPGSSCKLLPAGGGRLEHSLGMSTGRLFPSAKVIR